MLHVGDEFAYYLAAILGGAEGLLERLEGNRPKRSYLCSLDSGVRIVCGQVPIPLLLKHEPISSGLCMVYCRRITNTLKEKFSLVSGRADLVVELHASSDSVSGLSEAMSALVLSATEVLAGHRGEWSVGGYYHGGWEVQMEAVTSGGLQYAQLSKISISVDVRRG